jgi:phosphosulfolactate synthase (CoM biosynthesis protein A)
MASAHKPSSTTASGPATLNQTQAMNQDYQQVMQPPVSNLMGNAFFTVQRDPLRAKVTELVTVSTDNGLIWFHPDAASGSGWAHEVSEVFHAPQQNGGPAVPNALLPFYQRDTLFVFAEYDNAPGTGAATSQLLGMQRTEKNGWEQASVPVPLLGTLASMAQADLYFGQDGQGYLYGVSYADSLDTYGEFLIVGFAPFQRNQPGNDQLAALYQETPTAPTSYKLLPGAKAGEFVILRLQGSVATFQAGTLENGNINLTGSPSSQDLGVGDLAADTVVPIPLGSDGTPSFLLLAADQGLYLVSGNGLNGGPTASATLVTGGTNQPAGLVSVTGGAQADGSGFTAFALDTGYALWTLAQPTAGGDYAWVVLGNSGIAIAAPTFMDGGPELFICDPATVVSHITQRAATGSWFTLPIATPSPSTKPISETSSYTQQFAMKSAAGVPMGGELVNVCADPAQVLVVGGIAYNASPTQPATVRTDAAGNLVIASAATGLASPVLTVTAAALDSGAPPASYRGDLQLHQRIAGQGGFSYSGQDLISGGVLPPSASSSDADSLASNLQQVSGVAVNIATGATSDSARPPTAFTMTIKDRRLHHRAITPEEFAAFAGGGAAESVLGDAWGDVAHFCKQVWDDIESIAIQIYETTANIAVKIYNEAKKIYEWTQTFVLTTIDDIRDALEVMLQWCAKIWDDVVNVIEKFIEFIKLLFDWGNILNTKTVLRYTIEQLFLDMQDSTTGAQVWIGGQINQLIGNIDAVFAQLESVFEPGMTFASAGQNPTSTAMQQQSQANAVQNNYVMSKSLVPMPQLNPPVTTSGYDPQTAWEQGVIGAFETAFANSEATVVADWGQIKDFMQDIDSVSSFLDFVIASFLTTCQATIDIILQFIDAVIDSMLDVMAGAVICLNAYLEKKIDIPVISALYKLISGGDTLTMLDLICLIVAVPTTIAYEILHDAPPFTSAQVAAITSHPIPWPWSGDFHQGQVAGPFAVLALAPAAYQGLIEVLAAVSNGAYAACDVICDIANIKGQASDGDTGDLVTAASALGIGFNAIAAIAGAPWYAPNPSGSPAAGYELGTFAAGLLPVIADTIFFTYRKKLSRMQFQGGPWISMALGAVQTGMGVATAVEMAKNAGDFDYSLADELAGALSGLSNLGKPFVFLEELGGVCVVALDLAGDIGTIITDVAADTK